MQMMNVTSNVSSSVGSLSVVQLADRQKKIREMILKDSFISTQQMSVVLSVVKRTVERDLATIERQYPTSTRQVTPQVPHKFHLVILFECGLDGVEDFGALLLGCAVNGVAYDALLVDYDGEWKS